MPLIREILAPLKTRLLTASVAVALAISGFGCSHYHLGTEGKLAFRTLYVEPVANKSMLPQAQALMSTQLRERFARDSRITLVNSAEGADATLHVVIEDY